MILLRKKKEDGTYFDFKKILQNGYIIKEQPNEISKKQFANGNRKKIITNYNDVVINIDLACFDGDTLSEYIKELTDGEYQYYSLNDKIMKNANFIITIPELQIKNSSSYVFVGEFTALLEKSSDVK
jgi:hypothetical protein|nr:MAG TPA: hypothetical protein [Caudoviricetes sp.]